MSQSFRVPILHGNVHGSRSPIVMSHFLSLSLQGFDHSLVLVTIESTDTIG